MDWEVQGSSWWEFSLFWTWVSSLSLLSLCERYIVTIVPTLTAPPLLFSHTVLSFWGGHHEDKHPREAAWLGWEERVLNLRVLAITPTFRVDSQLRVCTAGVHSPGPQLGQWTWDSCSVVFMILAPWATLSRRSTMTLLNLPPSSWRAGQLLAWNSLRW